jgi:hypothetical protein
LPQSCNQRVQPLRFTAGKIASFLSQVAHFHRHSTESVVFWRNNAHPRLCQAFATTFGRLAQPQSA